MSAGRPFAFVEPSHVASASLQNEGSAVRSEAWLRERLEVGIQKVRSGSALQLEAEREFTELGAEIIPALLRAYARACIGESRLANQRARPTIGKTSLILFLATIAVVSCYWLPELLAPVVGMAVVVLWVFKIQSILPADTSCDAHAILCALRCAYKSPAFRNGSYGSRDEAAGMAMALLESARLNSRNYDPILAVAILRDIAQSGDCRFAGLLERLCDAEKSIDSHIRTVAREILPPIKSKWSASQASLHLLRSAPSRESNSLLRAGSVNSRGNDAFLLRSSVHIVEE